MTSAGCSPGAQAPAKGKTAETGSRGTGGPLGRCENIRRTVMAWPWSAILLRIGTNVSVCGGEWRISAALFIFVSEGRLSCA